MNARLQAIEERARELLEEVAMLIGEREISTDKESTQVIDTERIRSGGGYLIRRKPLPE